MPVDTSAPPSDTRDAALPTPLHPGHGNRAGARRHAALDPTIDARPAAIGLAERERSAIELRKADCTYQQIADDLGYKSPAGARSAVLRGLGRWMREADEELRVLELARTDEIGQRLWPLMRADDPDVALKAVVAYLRLLDYRAKITGLYNVKPPTHEMVVVPVVPKRDPEQVLADVHRFMVFTNQIREENAAGIAQDEVVEAVSHLDERDDADEAPELWPPTAPTDSRVNVLTVPGLASAQP